MIYFFQRKRLELEPVWAKVKNKTEDENSADWGVDDGEDEEDGGDGGSIADHVEGGAEAGRLVEVEGCLAVDGV